MKRVPGKLVMGVGQEQEMAPKSPRTKSERVPRIAKARTSPNGRHATISRSLIIE